MNCHSYELHSMSQIYSSIAARYAMMSGLVGIAAGRQMAVALRNGWLFDFEVASDSWA